MTDRQMLLAIKLRANKRASNFIFIKILDELLLQTGSIRLERDVIDKFKLLCQVYGIGLNETDCECINIDRPNKLDDLIRKKRLKEVGFIC